MNNYITQGTTITVQTAVLKIKIAEYPKIFPKKLYLARYSQYTTNVFENKNCRISKNIFKLNQVWHDIRNKKGINNLKKQTL